MNTSPNESAILNAAKLSCLDDSCRLVQDAIGQPAGDVAAMFFSGRDDQNREWDAAWPAMSESERETRLREYLAYEMRWHEGGAS